MAALHFTPETIKKDLLDSIHSLRVDSKQFLNNPGKDFTRHKLISFEQAMLFPMCIGSGNLGEEMLDFFTENGLPSDSAMIQQRQKIKPDAYAELFRRFTKTLSSPRKFKGLRVVAIDGSRLNLPLNTRERATLVDTVPNRKPYNQLHLNAAYDVLNKQFLDVILQEMDAMNEDDAACTMIDRYPGKEYSTLFLLDRGYVSYNLIAHFINNKQFFLIRMPSSHAKSVFKDDSSWFKKEEADVKGEIFIGRQRTKKSKMLKNYHYISAGRRYDYLPLKSKETDSFQVRVLKFPLSSGNYEYIITNLPESKFSLQTVKELYHERWGIETAFRKVKYQECLSSLHSSKKKYILQEIYAKLTMYNFTSAIIEAGNDNVQQTDTKYRYEINCSYAAKLCMKYIKGTVSGILELMQKKKVPDRPGRSYKRTLRRQSADTLQYR